MSLWEILIISYSVSVDAFAVSTSGALCKSVKPRRICAFNAALFFGVFQFIMPVGGFFAARSAAKLVDTFGPWTAAVLLGAVGGKMIIETLKKSDDSAACPIEGKGDFFDLKNLIIPAVATSIDAFAVGAGFAFAGKQLWIPAAAMGIITAVNSALGVFIGAKIRSSGKERLLPLIGGAAIIAIGIKMLF